MLIEFKPQWDKIPEKYEYVAQDRSGKVYAYGTKPLLCKDGWVLSSLHQKGHLYLGSYLLGDWKNSLIRRPNTKEAGTVSVHIEQAVDALLKEIRDNLSPVVKDALNDNELFELVPDEKLEVYLCGWLLAKGVPVKDLDLTKYGVKSLVDQK